MPENSNYLTYTALALSIMSLWSVLIKKRDKLADTPNKGNVLTFLFIAVTMFLISLPAIISVKGFNLFLPSYFLFKLLPMFRVYSRAGIFVVLAVSILAGFGLSFILQRIKTMSRHTLVIVFVLTLIAFENLNFPPFSFMDVSKLPQTYQWLKTLPMDAKVVEYPKDNSVVDVDGGCPGWLDEELVRDYNSGYALFYQTIHGKQLVRTEYLPLPERVVLGDLSREAAYKVLKKYEVNFIIVHTKDPMIGIHPWPYPQENPLDACWQRRIMKKPEKVYEGFIKVAEFNDGVVYKVQ